MLFRVVALLFLGGASAQKLFGRLENLSPAPNYGRDYVETNSRPATLGEMQALTGEAFYAFAPTSSYAQDGSAEGICYKIIIGKVILAVATGAPRVPPNLADKYTPGVNAAAIAASGSVRCLSGTPGSASLANLLGDERGCCSSFGQGLSDTDGTDYFADWDARGPYPGEVGANGALEPFAGTWLFNNYFSDQGAQYLDDDLQSTETFGPGPWIIAHLDPEYGGQWEAPGHTRTSICKENPNYNVPPGNRDKSDYPDAYTLCNGEAVLPVNFGPGEWDHWPCPMIDVLDPTETTASVCEGTFPSTPSGCGDLTGTQYTVGENINDGTQCEEGACYANVNVDGKYPTEQLGCFKCGELHGRVGYVYMRITSDAAILGPQGQSYALSYHDVQRWEAMENADIGARQGPYAQATNQNENNDLGSLSHGNQWQNCVYQFMIFHGQVDPCSPGSCCPPGCPVECGPGGCPPGCPAGGCDVCPPGCPIECPAGGCPPGCPADGCQPECPSSCCDGCCPPGSPPGSCSPGAPICPPGCGGCGNCCPPGSPPGSCEEGQPPCPPSCSPVTARKDPHLHFAHGGYADLRGEDGAVFNFLSARNVSFNVKTEAADFKWSHRVVHGTRLSAAYWTIRTDNNHMLQIEYDATTAYRATVRNLNDTAINTLKVASHESAAYSLDNVLVKLTGHELSVTVKDAWLITVKQAAFPFKKLNQKKTLLDVSAQALYDADHDVVAPHGLFGQSYDGDNVAISGKVDKRSGDETSTEAQAEGAIEGVYTDYKVPPTNPFSTAFKYSRFDAIAAKPRDVSKLTGAKSARSTPKLAEATADDVPADAK